MTDQPNTVALANLRRALALVLDAVEANHGPSVLVDHDLYFTLGLRKMFSALPPAPDEFSTCQLADDLIEVDTILQRADAGDILTPWHDLQHLVGVLSALAAVDLPDRIR